MANVQAVAVEWAKLGIEDARFASSLRKRYKALLDASITPGGLNTVTQASKDAVSMSKQIGLSVPETMQAMRFACQWIDDGRVPLQSRSLGRF